MEVFHPMHRTAWSLRTSGMPLYAVTSDGRVEKVPGGTRKHACFLKVPDGTAVLLWCYATGGWHGRVHVLQVVDGLPEITMVDDLLSPEEVKAELEKHLPPPVAEAAYRVAVDWLFR